MPAWPGKSQAIAASELSSTEYSDMKECSKSIVRRLSHPNFINRYFVGNGVDIGGKPDPLALYRELFGQMKSVKTWDLEDGDAQYMEGVTDDTFDFVHSSHCLEHLHDPAEGLRNWLRVVKPGGYVVVIVPDEDMYEQGVFPSEFNRDHKWTFTIFKRESWSDRSVNLLELLCEFGPAAGIEKIERLTATYRTLPRYDQTRTPLAECGIEFILRKRTSEEIRNKGLTTSAIQPERELRLHYNQYRDDMATLRANNPEKPPFTNGAEL